MGAILHPEAVECSVLTVAILLVSICAKFYMYCYNRGVGKKISAAGHAGDRGGQPVRLRGDRGGAACDACGAFPALADRRLVRLGRVAAHPVGGVQAARDTLSPLLGQPPSEEFVQEIRDIVMESQVVCGIHDLVVHDYGPDA